MISKVLRITSAIVFLACAGCSSLAPLLTQPTPASVSQTTATPQPIPSATSVTQPVTEARVLRVWLPPRFDPNATTPAAALLRQRLIDFEDLHPGLEIDIRIKAEAGETGMFNALSITSLAAPSALPDLIALSRPDMEAAAGKGLLHPMDGLSTLLDDPNWYPYARELGHIQDIGYGLPFAGDTLVLMHPPDLELNTWEDIVALGEPLTFPAGDPQALMLLSLYVSAGGKLVNEQGLPILEEGPLTRALTLIQSGVEAGTFLPSLLELGTDEQAYQLYSNRRTRLVIAWASNQSGAADDTLQAIPGLTSPSQTFARGWIWALAGSEPENQQAATELAEFLIADDFVHEWISDTGYFSTRYSNVANSDGKLNALLETAQALPSNDVLFVLGPILNQALKQVLSGEQVEVVVRSVMEQIQ